MLRRTANLCYMNYNISRTANICHMYYNISRTANLCYMYYNISRTAKSRERKERKCEKLPMPPGEGRGVKTR